MNETGNQTLATLYREAELERVLDDMAWQLLALLGETGRIVLVGILRRGAPLAERLLLRLHRLRPGLAVERLDLSLKRYADDLTLLHPEVMLTEHPDYATLDLGGQTVVVVDDVLYQGFSLARAVQYLAGKGAARVISVVLADRACSRLPLRADVCGVTLQVAPQHIIECHVQPYEAEFELRLAAQPGDELDGA